MISFELYQRLIAVCPGRLVNNVWQPDPQATTEQRAAAQALINAWPAQQALEQARRSAAQRIDAGYAASVADHFAVAGKLWKLRAEDMSLIAARVTHLLNKLALAATEQDREVIRATIIEFPTTLGVQSLPFSELSPIFDLYGDWLAPRLGQLTRLKMIAAVADAPTAAALDWSL